MLTWPPRCHVKMLCDGSLPLRSIYIMYNEHVHVQPVVQFTWQIPPMILAKDKKRTDIQRNKGKIGSDHYLFTYFKMFTLTLML